MPKLRTLFALVIFITPAFSQSRPLVKGRVVEWQRHRLAGNTRAEANPQNDRGRVADGFAMEHMLLQLQRPAEQERALREAIDAQHDPKSPNYHRWLTAADFGRQYGPAQSDIDTVTAWLESHGFKVNAIYPSGMLIDFSGTAAQVAGAFGAEIHHLSVNGESHVANISDPQIPDALAPLIAGIASMHDFRPRAMKSRRKYTYSQGRSTYQAMTPTDLATIYNLSPLFASGYTGKGQTIAVVEDTDLYDPGDWDNFRAAFGLAQYTSGSLSTVHPAAANGINCRAPGVLTGDDGEAILDAEWAAAAAPDAAILVAACGSTRSTFGGVIALENLINSGTPPSVISISYGECEALNGSGANALFNSVYQQAAAEGLSIFVAAGDEGAASCDAGTSGATHGIGVSGWASTPYNVAVGGTDFSDTVDGTNSTYWASTNNADFSSAMSYIPEIPWNDSCAGSLLAGYLGYSSGFGSDGFCASTTARTNDLLQVAAGSGGPSGCATGSPQISGVVGGSCAGYAKPAWQTGVPGIPDDSVRDLPDVSLFAGGGIWGHYYVTCYSNPRGGGSACTGDPSNWSGAGGTSFGAPIMAGIQAIVNQKMGGPQGNPNAVYYRLAATDGALCNSSNGDTTSSACVFHNVTRGDIAVNCGGTDNCFGATATGRRASATGAMSLSQDSYSPAYGAAAGWNFATGIGSINAFNLVMNWQ